jgi:type IV pilus assembly protein PilN
MIRINLLPEVRGEKVARAPLVSLEGTNVNSYIVLILLIVGLAYAGVTYWRLTSNLKTIQAEIAVQQREYDRLKEIIAEVEAYKKRATELERKIGVIEKLKENQLGPVRIMDEVSKALPDLLWLTNMDLKGTTLAIRGQAMNENAVANFIANLTASPFFAEPNLRVMQQDNRGIFSFDLSVAFTYAPKAAAAASAPRS